MIRYALICADCEHEFEAWFASSEAYDKQVERDLVECAACGSTHVHKQIMAPAVRTASQDSAQAQNMMRKMAAATRKHISENCDYVGDRFAEEARAIHNGEGEDRAIWGETTSEEREALKEEGVPASPLPPMFAPKPPKRAEDLN